MGSALSFLSVLVVVVLGSGAEARPMSAIRDTSSLDIGDEEEEELLQWCSDLSLDYEQYLVNWSETATTDLDEAF